MVSIIVLWVVVVLNLIVHIIWAFGLRRTLLAFDVLHGINARLLAENAALRGVLTQVGVELSHYDDGVVQLVPAVPLLHTVRRES